MGIRDKLFKNAAKWITSKHWMSQFNLIFKEGQVTMIVQLTTKGKSFCGLLFWFRGLFLGFGLYL